MEKITVIKSVEISNSMNKTKDILSLVYIVNGMVKLFGVKTNNEIVECKTKFIAENAFINEIKDIQRYGYKVRKIKI